MILLSQSLVVFAATKHDFITATTRVWPQGIELSSTIAALSLTIVISIVNTGTTFSENF